MYFVHVLWWLMHELYISRMKCMDKTMLSAWFVFLIHFIHGRIMPSAWLDFFMYFLRKCIEKYVFSKKMYEKSCVFQESAWSAFSCMKCMVKPCTSCLAWNTWFYMKMQAFSCKMHEIHAFLTKRMNLQFHAWDAWTHAVHAWNA
mgnify:CR=1 FL=1